MLDHISKYREESEKKKKRRKRRGGGEGGGGVEMLHVASYYRELKMIFHLIGQKARTQTLLERSHIVTDVTSICHVQNTVTYGDKGCFLLCVKTEF